MSRPRLANDESIGKMHAMYARGSTLTAIGRKFHKSAVTVMRYLHTFGTTMRPRGRRPILAS